MINPLKLYGSKEEYGKDNPIHTLRKKTELTDVFKSVSYIYIKT